jgi:hypothetical protein
VVSNECGDTPSQNFRVLVKGCTKAPEITEPTTNQTRQVNRDGTLELAVTAYGNGETPTYRWKKSPNGVDTWDAVESDGTDATYQVPTGTSGTYYYHCDVTNNCETTTSAKFTVTVHKCTAAPEVSLAEESPIIEVNKNATRSISVTADNKGDTDLDYRWESSQTGEVNSWLPITSDGNSDTYTVPTTASGTLFYRCLVKNACGTTPSDVYQVIVRVCADAPAAPDKITFSKVTGIKLGDEITATAETTVTTGDRIPTKYNWTIPGNFVYKSTEDPRSITLTATGGGTITDAIKVNAENDCGPSADYSNTTTLKILDCSDAPAQPVNISVSSESVVFGSTFTASIDPVDNAISYTWTLIDGLKTSTGGTTITTTAPNIAITGAKVGTYPEGSIKVKANNDCGSSDDKASAIAVAVTVKPCVYEVKNGAYTGSPKTVAQYDTVTITSFSGAGDLCLYDGDGSNANRYTASTAASECSGLRTSTGVDWRLPNIKELWGLRWYYESYGIGHGAYWSSSSSDTKKFWVFKYIEGEFGPYSLSATSQGARVRCVRTLPTP